MKTIEIYSDHRCMIVKAKTVYDAIIHFQRLYPKEKVTFAHDTEFINITSQFKHESKEVFYGKSHNRRNIPNQ